MSGDIHSTIKDLDWRIRLKLCGTDLQVYKMK